MYILLKYVLEKNHQYYFAIIFIVQNILPGSKVLWTVETKYEQNKYTLIYWNAAQIKINYFF